MNPIEFPEVTHRIAEHQDEYVTLPAHIEDNGNVTFCWSLSWRERLTLLLTGRLWHSVLTFRSPLQPQLLQVQRPTFPVAVHMPGSDA